MAAIEVFEGYDAVVLADKPVGYWPLDERTGPWAFDQSGNGNTGRIVGGVTLGQPGVVPGTYAMGFNGATGVVQLSKEPVLSTAVSIEAWAYTVQTANFAEVFNNNQIFLRQESTSEANGFAVFVKLSNGSVEPRAQNGVAVVTNTWYHLVATWNGTTLSLYVNGALAATSGRAGILTTTTVTATIGAGEQTNPAFNYWDGRLGRVAIYSYALSPDRIAIHHLAGVNHA